MTDSFAPRAAGADSQTPSPDDLSGQRVIGSTFEFQIERAFLSPDGWIAAGWQIRGLIRPGARARAKNGAEIVFGALYTIARVRGREKMEFWLQERPANPHLIKSGDLMEGHYTVVLPPFRPLGDGRALKSIADRRAEQIAADSRRPRSPMRQTPIMLDRVSEEPSNSPSSDSGGSQGVSVWRFR